ncbi:hypothetical protein BpHYR1_037766 [Brachionus plicatilis]|uniref:Uncharacterized protein n=1 Tax=Brachionus plicatilis TaxID=10195 RepID=A0A3M7R9Y8_BRAPC|nr:hypothetical protein BpHYR1_037766 [Brachionus plicatilis]
MGGHLFGKLGGLNFGPILEENISIHQLIFLLANKKKNESYLLCISLPGGSHNVILLNHPIAVRVLSAKYIADLVLGILLIVIFPEKKERCKERHFNAGKTALKQLLFSVFSVFFERFLALFSSAFFTLQNVEKTLLKIDSIEGQRVY